MRAAQCASRVGVCCRCGHCQALAPKWVKLSEALKGVIKVAAINCEEHADLCAKQGYSHALLPMFRIYHMANFFLEAM